MTNPSEGNEVDLCTTKASSSVIDIFSSTAAIHNSIACDTERRSYLTWPKLPPWAIEEERKSWGQLLHLLEWEDDYDSIDRKSKGYRELNGWKGSDLIHSSTSPVRVLEYRLKYKNHASCGDSEKIVDSTECNDRMTQPQTDMSEIPSAASPTNAATITGIIHFTSRAESHKGYCHGGSMCSIMDDIVGWTGFCASGRCLPWSGYTVQVNTKLMKPVPIGKVLRLECCIIRMERRKVYVVAKLLEPVSNGNVSEKEIVYAEADGLVILNRGVLPGL